MWEVREGTIVKDKRKIGIAIAIGLLVCVCAVGLYKAYVHYFYHVRETQLYKIETSYRLEGEDIGAVENTFQEGSGEYFFLEGLKAYDLRNYYIAEENFKKAREVSHSDKALLAYLYYYMNQCIVEQNELGVGDVELVSLALQEATKYVPLANDTKMLWSLISSISYAETMDKKAIELIEVYLQEERHLELATWAWMKNYIAMLEFNGEEYSNSIRNFYDVEVALVDSKLTPELRYELQYAREYIANIYSMFEEYEKAAMLYEEVYKSSLENGDFDSYGCCINMATAYLEIADTQKARQAMESLESNLDKMDELYVPEVEATICDVYANIYLLEGDYEQAEASLEKAEAFYKENVGNAFYGGEYFVLLSRCKYMVHQGMISEAQIILEEFMDSGDAAYLGLEDEVYELLESVYQQTGQKDKLIAIYDIMLDNNEEFKKTTQQEYLKFSEYYRENGELRVSNSRLHRRSLIAIVACIAVTVILVFSLILIRLLTHRNVTDQLTGVYNRKKLNHLLKKYEKNGTASDLAVVMMDIDYFKRYNDTYGHQAGDVVLREVSTILRESVRKKDVVIRYGGEEFLVLISGIKQKTAEEICQRIYTKLEEKALPHEASRVSDHITMSMGLCYQKDKNSMSLEKLIGKADEALYKSKENGRNRLTVCEN